MKQKNFPENVAEAVLGQKVTSLPSYVIVQLFPVDSDSYRSIDYCNTYNHLAGMQMWATFSMRMAIESRQGRVLESI